MMNQQQYSQLVNDELDDGVSPKQSRTSNKTKILLLGAALVLLGFVAGLFFRVIITSPENVSMANACEECIPLVKQDVRHYPEFEAPPPKNGGQEPVWDSMIPNGVGYVSHSQLVPNTSMVGVFHQLHCLYLIRRAYYANPNLKPKRKTSTWESIALRTRDIALITYGKELYVQQIRA
ncbi:hypothetical protein TSTA_088020 [Talaromyces stipitatus ATCC 10500]|uniref:Uncharacterized protein n=1 Tax=Talaromyces stipitatus (strain ATCC 10500 / CBS 375.48 / QM 6759 / NRRL 1006) TaxID=441959 RepID=B8M2A2_TALSN|nr:uncharacterized protein TSTA_088020 [Talaromyces stipitatus ATCC 10500]EED21566.1 hypothetical protein TSTA_088020 [Talaromyces stipitatus ATCC 10500]